MCILEVAGPPPPLYIDNTTAVKITLILSSMTALNILRLIVTTFENLSLVNDTFDLRIVS